METEKTIILQNLLREEQNYIEILKGYLGNKLEHSDDYNKIYPLVEKIFRLHKGVVERTEHFICFRR
ncbi:MAG: hypothetical protein MRZ62_08265 [Brachyspira sp.]|nr:hypothetical protein [Brachyspira sp.]